MIRLLKIEFIKVKKYRAFWAVLGIYALIFLLVTGTIKMVEPDNPAQSFFSFPDVWHHLAYVASFLNILPAILIIMLIANEYTFRTFRQNLIDGLSRSELVFSKFILIGMIALLCIAFIFLVGLTRGLLTGHFDSLAEIFDEMHFLLRLFIQMAGYMSVAAVIVFIFKRAAMSILIYLVYVVALERLIRWRTADEIDRYFPMNVFGGLIPDTGTISIQGIMESASLSAELTLLLACLYIAGLFGASLALMHKSDL